MGTVVMESLNPDAIYLDETINPARKVKLPCNKCDGDCCGPVPMPRDQLETIWNKYNFKDKFGDMEQYITNTVYVLGVPNITLTIGKSCLFKISETKGGCMIYEDRPTICKVYGVTDLVRCPYEGLKKQPKDLNIRKQCVIKKDLKLIELQQVMIGRVVKNKHPMINLLKV